MNDTHVLSFIFVILHISRDREGGRGSNARFTLFNSIIADRGIVRQTEQWIDGRTDRGANKASSSVAGLRQKTRW